MEHALMLRVILEKPPADVDFGLQKGRGSSYETIQTQRSEGNDISFQFTVGMKGVNRDAGPTLVGPLVQGPPDARFIYIDIGTYAGQKNTPWSRRLKIPLTGITWEMIDCSGGSLEARIPGTGKDGGPTCGTVKAFEGWKPSR
jgi:hypothetical protein